MEKAFGLACKKAGSADHVAVLFGVSSSWVRAQVAKEQKGLEPGSAELKFRLSTYLKTDSVLPPLDEILTPQQQVVACYHAAMKKGKI